MSALPLASLFASARRSQFSVKHGITRFCTLRNGTIAAIVRFCVEERFTLGWCRSVSPLAVSRTICTQDVAPSASHAAEQFEPRGITAEDTVVFIIGCVPFVWAGIEFWRRSACLHSLLLLVLFPSLSPRHAKVCCTPAHNSRRVRMREG